MSVSCSKELAVQTQEYRMLTKYFKLSLNHLILQVTVVSHSRKLLYCDRHTLSTNCSLMTKWFKARSVCSFTKVYFLLTKEPLNVSETETGIQIV